MKRIILILLLISCLSYATHDTETILRYPSLIVTIGWHTTHGSYFPNYIDQQKMVSKFFLLNQYIEKQFEVTSETTRIVQLSIYYIYNQPYFSEGQITRSPHNYEIQVETRFDNGDTGPMLKFYQKLVDFMVSDSMRSRKMHYQNRTSQTWVDSLPEVPQPPSSISLTPHYPLIYSDLLELDMANVYDSTDIQPDSSNLKLEYKDEAIQIIWHGKNLPISANGIKPTMLKDRLVVSDKDSVYVFDSTGAKLKSIPTRGHFYTYQYHAEHTSEVYDNWVNFTNGFHGIFLSYCYSKNAFYWLKGEFEK